MAIPDKKAFKNILLKYFPGFVLGIIASAIVAFFFLQKPGLSVQILSNTNVVDVKEDTKGLDILYNGKSIKNEGDVLKVLTIGIGNSGNAPIRENDFASNAPLGIKIDSGEIIETPQIIASSNDYLANNVKPILQEKNRVVFSPVILNQGDYFTVKLLVLYHGDSKDLIEPVVIGGSIAGIKEIEILKRDYHGQGSIIMWQIICTSSIALTLTLFWLVVRDFRFRNSRREMEEGNT